MEINNGHDTVLRHIDTQVFDRSYFRGSGKLLPSTRKATSVKLTSNFPQLQKFLSQCESLAFRPFNRIFVPEFLRYSAL